MTTATKRPNLLVSLLLLVVAIAVGAHVSAIPLLLTKAGTATILLFVYGYFAVRIVTPLRIGATGLRAVVGLALGAATLYVTWAIRIPAFSGWDVPFTADPKLILDAIALRSESMSVSRGFGAGTTADGPSWLMLGTYLTEAFFFVGVMTLCSLLSGPDAPEEAGAGEDDEAAEGSARTAA